MLWWSNEAWSKLRSEGVCKNSHFCGGSKSSCKNKRTSIWILFLSRLSPSNSASHTLMWAFFTFKKKLKDWNLVSSDTPHVAFCYVWKNLVFRSLGVPSVGSLGEVWLLLTIKVMRQTPCHMPPVASLNKVIFWRSQEPLGDLVRSKRNFFSKFPMGLIRRFLRHPTCHLLLHF